MSGTDVGLDRSVHLDSQNQGSFELPFDVDSDLFLCLNSSKIDIDHPLFGHGQLLDYDLLNILDPKPLHQPHTGLDLLAVTPKPTPHSSRPSVSLRTPTTTSLLPAVPPPKITRGSVPLDTANPTPQRHLAKVFYESDPAATLHAPPPGPPLSRPAPAPSPLPPPPTAAQPAAAVALAELASGASQAAEHARSGRPRAALALLAAATGAAACGCETLGLAGEDAPAAARLGFWRALNGAWLELVASAAAAAGSTSQATFDAGEWRLLARCVAAWGDTLARYGLVDYENGLWESDILDEIDAAGRAAVQMC
ncbi:hypothetical protein HK405_008860 [Cladochytrium tenue]|nr:hypothetical protein HK405_008860 [Cladochytrium tenue]